MKSSASRITGAAMAAVVLLGACTSAATPAPTAAPSPSAGATKTTDGTLPKPELAELRIGASVQEPSQFAPKLAQMAGIYEKYGIKVTFTTFNADGDAVQAMLSGQIDYSSVGAGGIINSQLTDAPASTFVELKIKVIDGLFCQKDIKTAADIKGKAVAVSTLGGTGHASALLALEGLKLTDKDVIIQQVGGQAVRIAALKAGSVACAPVGMDLAKDMTDLGLNLLIDLSKTDLPWPATGISALKSFTTKNPNTTLIVVAANLEAQELIYANPKKAAEYWATYAQLDAAKAEAQINAFLPQGNRGLAFPTATFTFAQKVMATVTPGIMTVDVTKAMDLSVLKKLAEIGFYKKIGAPDPVFPN
ncbi:MAG TPA: ABC transporter substrate-binding protein [Nonomuraea sp.]|nr:ABC transporter substrate-binding protein [Nonomuraea sp.]